MLVIIDNYDSFTYNLVQYVRELGQSVAVYFNDQIGVEELMALHPRHIILSPGPGGPEASGICLSLLKSIKNIPILGVCLGHQALGYVFGAKIIKAKQVMHGKTSLVYHNEQSLFSQIKSPFTAMRYHSLIIDNSTLSPDFLVTAWTEEGEIMAIAHKQLPFVGVQFHPESIASESGHTLLQNFLSS